jgi:hypothetical protein
VDVSRYIYCSLELTRPSDNGSIDKGYHICLPEYPANDLAISFVGPRQGIMQTLERFPSA